jgi:hypothetical protein
MKAIHKQMVFVAVIALAGIFMAASGAAADSLPQANADDSRWHVTVEGYLPPNMMIGHSAVQGNKTNVNFGLDDLLETLDEVQVILGGRFEVSKGKFAFLYDGNYLKAKDEVNTNASGLPLSVNAKITVKLGLQEWAGAYQIGKWNTGGAQNKPLTVDLVAGARQMYLSVDQDTATTLSIPIIGSLVKNNSMSATKSWIDPFIGGRLTFPLRDRLILGFRADVGGFGAASDFAWNTIIETRYYFTANKNAFTSLGFRAFGDYYNEEDFKFHLVNYGPIISAGYRF